MNGVYTDMLTGMTSPICMAECPPLSFLQVPVQLGSPHVGLGLGRGERAMGPIVVTLLKAGEDMIEWVSQRGVSSSGLGRGR